MLQAEQSRKGLSIEDKEFFFEFRPCFTDSFNDSFGQLGHEHVFAFVFNVGRFGLRVLIRTRSPPFVAGVDFDEESFGRVLVIEEKRLVQHHRFDSVERYVVIGSRKTLLGKRFHHASQPMQRRSHYAVVPAILAAHLLRAT
jgi:hypothetical protein